MEGPIEYSCLLVYAYAWCCGGGVGAKKPILIGSATANDNTTTIILIGIFLFIKATPGYESNR